ncbi:hypothetical protein Ddye_020339 [Dipteronia dyeriana]|uniref:Ubiquitin-like protease family profile domain-containing protein n=1 Tax=Dipteronia dyeriana TaxID=168575 RepID=A0AAD9TZH9_9ROSI|nr:hypothetical protein Ddye_020339 [Dipteronia dyeriana]
MPRDTDGEVKTLRWKVLKNRWSADDLTTVLNPCNVGRQHWLLASMDLTTGIIHILDPFRQDVPVSI